MKVAARFARTIAVAFNFIPVLIDATGGQIVKRITVTRPRHREFAPVNVAGNEDNALSSCLPNQLDHLQQLTREIRPRLPALVLMAELNAAADDSQICGLFKTLLQPRLLLGSRKRSLGIGVGQVIILPACERGLERRVAERAGIEQDDLQFSAARSIFEATRRADARVLTSWAVR